MADPDIRKRLNYYTGLFLQEEDFIAEQNYHVSQQKEQNKLLLTPGIVDPNTGLAVTVSADKTKVTVSAGVAIDAAGNQLIVFDGDENRKDIATTSTTEQDVFLTLSSQELITDAPPGGTGTRIFAKPKFEVIPTNQAPSEDVKIRLAQLKIRSTGIVGTPDFSVRKAAGVRVAGGLAGLKVGGTEVRSPGGTIELIQGGAIALTPNNTTQQITISENHSTLKNNPHTVTAAQVGALPSVGGNVTGNLNVLGTNIKLNVQTATPGLTGTPGAAFVWNNPTGVDFNTTGCCGLVAKITSAPGIAPNPVSAAIAGIAGIDKVNGVYATAKTGTHALNVEGTARITGQISSTHLVDTFINASGQKLKTGDVIKLKGTPVTRFRGLNNKAPVAEVTLADRENDPLVIGIVDCEAIPDAESPDTRMNPEDPTFIENGGELYVVTLGTFAHCQVDATEAPIEVGDLLTSSKNPGHAKKATTPQIGSIIGKALEPMAKGTGYIAVFVNIQ
ncbi:hypothetical protein QUB56_28965 [Microcoleus sp. AR_TQ3_B6]|uniref:hypothetical protein n=1 Tax=Microcoleus sp. AR_TQ3_B6 TaxID=3055284 RepID=UPI002FD59540